MSAEIIIQPMNREAFLPFGDVFDASGEPDKMINQGFCGRYHDVAKLDFLSCDADDGRAGISLFDAQPRALPYLLDMMERHPLGSQAFIPMNMKPFLVIVAEDESGRPGWPIAFKTETGQGINFHRNIWHGVLTPLHAPGLFAVIDRIGEGNNLEEFWFEQPYRIVRASE